jgi:hypothetical protein
MERIINTGNSSIDLDRIRAIRHNSHRDLGKTNVLIIEYNARIEYSKNPFTEKIEKTEIVDKIEIEYVDFETAQANHVSIQEEWNNYLENKA